MESQSFTFKRKIGKVMYIVELKSAKSAKEQYDTMLRKIITKESKKLDFKPKIASESQISDDDKK